MAEIKNILAGLNSKIRKYKVAFADEFIERVKVRTPVRSGRLQAGWMYEIAPDDVLFSDPVPYASHVEFGTYKMAPRGMLRATLMESQAISDIAAKKVGLT